MRRKKEQKCLYSSYTVKSSSKYISHPSTALLEISYLVNKIIQFRQTLLSCLNLVSYCNLVVVSEDETKNRLSVQDDGMRFIGRNNNKNCRWNYNQLKRPKSFLRATTNIYITQCFMPSRFHGSSQQKTGKYRYQIALRKCIMREIQ